MRRNQPKASVQYGGLVWHEPQGWTAPGSVHDLLLAVVESQTVCIYAQLIQKLFLNRFRPGRETVEFERTDIEKAARELGLRVPKNLGDLIYSFRYRVELPDAIRRLAPAGRHWIIRPAGRSRYSFVAVAAAVLAPNPILAETKIPDCHVAFQT